VGRELDTSVLFPNKPEVVVPVFAPNNEPKTGLDAVDPDACGFLGPNNPELLLLSNKLIFIIIIIKKFINI
jgi:hypothetical protein